MNTKKLLYTNEDVDKLPQFLDVEISDEAIMASTGSA